MTEVSDCDVQRPIHLAQAIPSSTLSLAMNSWLTGFT